MQDSYLPVLKMAESKKKKQDLQHPNWCFTLQYGGPKQPLLEDLEPQVKVLENKCTYIIYGKECAPTTGQRHLQGYCELRKPARLTELVKIISCHWEPAKGTGIQNKEYCSKEGDFHEQGELKIPPGDMERNRWDQAREEAVAGKQITDSQIFICHYSSVKAIQKDHMVLPEEVDGVCGLWIYGEAGTGKSWKARRDYPDHYLKMCNKWWDGYQGQPYVIIDDFDKNHHVLGHHLKIWADRYPFVAEIKQTATPMRPKKIIVTSQYSIEEIWPDEETRAALKRRFKCVRLGAPKDAPPEVKAYFNQPQNTICLTDSEDEDETNTENQPPKESLGFPLCRDPPLKSPSGSPQKKKVYESCSSTPLCVRESNAV